MGRLFKVWDGLGVRQKLAAGALGSALLAWVVGTILDFVSAEIPSLVPLMVIGNFISGSIMNQLVEGTLLGVALIGFGPTVIAYAKKIGRAKLNQIFVAGLLLTLVSAALLLVLMLVYQSIFYAPRVFDSPVGALKDSDGTARKFTAKSPMEIESPFAYDTLLRAQQSLDSERGLWIAITGIINDVSMDEDRSLLVSLAGVNTSEARLHFESKWQQRFAALPRGERVYAVCKIVDAAKLLLILDTCELVPS